MRTFETGATRDDDKEKIDPEGFLSVPALEAYFAYMHKHRKQSDGSLRPSSNWKKGINSTSYMQSMFRHFFAVWKDYTNNTDPTEDLCALYFNVQGMLHEYLKNGKFTRQGD